MSELFGKEASSHIMKSNIMKDDFNWEVPFESVPLPSNGIIYNPDTTLYGLETLQIKAMTAKEEDILASRALLKEGSVITNLIKSCLIDKTIDPTLMISGDRNALMVSIRITGYGSNYPYTSICANCDGKNNNEADLSDLEIKRLTIDPVEKGKNEFAFTLPVTNKQITFKYLCDRDEKDREAAAKFLNNHTKSKISKSVTSFIESSILSIDGITDKNKIKHFVMHMPAFDSKALRQYINTNEPGINMSQNYTCTSCDHENNIKLPITPEFFWPST